MWEMMMHNENNNQVYRLNSGSSLPSAVNAGENSYKHMLMKSQFIGHIIVADS